jgi:hypothetical protein
MRKIGDKAMRCSTGCFARHCVLAVLVIGTLLIGRVHAEVDRTTEPFTNASLQGIFAVTNVGIGGQTPEAGVAVLRFDGQGKLNGVNVQNLPGDSNTERRLVKVPVTGTYQVEEDGTGTGKITGQLADGSLIERHFDLVLARARATGRFEVASKVFLMVRELSEPAKNLITFVATKLPSHGKFSLVSFKGTFAFRGFGPGNQAPAAGFGQITFDGKGRFKGFDILNVDASSFEGQSAAGDRMFIENPFDGTYSVDENGIYTASLANGGEAIFIMTKAYLKDNFRVAQEYFYIVPSESTLLTGGFFITSIGSKLPD